MALFSLVRETSEEHLDKAASTKETERKEQFYLEAIEYFNSKYLAIQSYLARHWPQNQNTATTTTQHKHTKQTNPTMQFRPNKNKQIA